MKQVTDRHAFRQQYFGKTGLGAIGNIPLQERARKYISLDSEGGIFFERELEFIKAQTFDVLYADLPARTMFPVSNEAPAGAETITYTVYDKVGQAKLAGNMADDIPRADVSGRQVTMPVKTLTIGYGYSIKDIQSSQMAGGLPLDARRAEAATRAMEELVNTLTFFGEGDFVNGGVRGLYNNPYVPRGSVAQGGSGNTAWSTKTADEILADINGVLSTINSDSKLIERANRIGLPPAQYNFIRSTRSSVTSASDTTILEYVVQNSQFIASAEDIFPVNELVGAVLPINAATPGGITGNDTDDLMLVYTLDRAKLELEIPQELTYLPVQEKNLEFLVPGYAYYGGLNLYFPGSMFFAGGI